jgi:hypothetical protein
VLGWDACFTVGVIVALIMALARDISCATWRVSTC